MQEQENIVLTADKMEKMLKKMANWKAPGPDLVQGFWLKNFRSMHGRMLIKLNECLNKGDVPNWMTKGRTVLIMKDKDEGNVASNCRPISWRTELTSCGENIGEVRIRRGIFQGDSLSPLLFVVVLVPMTLILRKARFAYEFQNGENKSSSLHGRLKVIR